MATRYWVGGSGTWTASNTANWSTSSGGPGGASAPTASDDVVFDSASNGTSYTVTIGADAIVTGYNTGGQLVVTGVTSGTVAVGQTVGFDATTFNPLYTITSLGTGSGGIGSYNLNASPGTTTTTFYLNFPQCNNITVAGPATGTVDFAGTLTTGFLCIFGSMTLPATGMTSSNTGVIMFTNTTTGNTITTNGVSLNNYFYFNGIGGGWTLGSALTTVNSTYIQTGTFDTGGYNFTTSAIVSSSSTVKTINLNASTLTLAGTSSITFSGSNLTLNAGTSTINCGATGATFNGGGRTFYNVDFTGGAGTKTISGANTFNNLSFSSSANTVVTFSANQTVNGNTTFAGNSQTLTLLSSTFGGTTTFSSSTVTGLHTITTTGGSFNNLTFTSLSATGRTAISLASNITVNGTLTLGTANTAIRRLQLISNTVGTQRIVTANAIATLSDVDFRDIVAAGASGTWSGTRLGNALNNSNITFVAGVPKYWNLAAGGNWSATAWATSSGGAVNVNNFPLAQDSIVIENTGLNTSATITIDASWFIPSISFSTRSNAMTFASGTNNPQFYGDLTLSTAVTISGTGTLNFLGQGLTQNITSAGKTFTQIFSVNAPSCTFKLLDAFNCSNATAFAVQRGTLDCNTYNFTAAGIGSNFSTTRSILLSSGTITLSGTAPINFATSTGLTLTAGTSTIICSDTTPTFSGGGLTFYNVSFTSTASNIVTMSGVNTFNNFTLTTPTTAAGLRTLNLFANQTINGTLTIGATNSGNKRILVKSDTVGTQRTLTVATIATLSDVNFADIVAAGASGTWSGTRLGNGGNNSNITFAAGVDKYWNLAAGGNLTDTAWALTSGGAVSNDNFPLPQDNIVVVDTGLNSGATITWNSSGGYFGTFNFSGRTLPMTLAASTASIIITKDFTLSSAVTLTGTGTFSWVGAGTTQNITTAGVTIPQNNSISNLGGTVKLIDNFTSSQANFTLVIGTLDLNNQILTCPAFASAGSGVRTIAFGTSSKIIVTGNNTTVWNTGTTTNLTITGTTYVELNYSGSTGTRTITAAAAGAVNTYITAGSDIVTTSGTTSFIDLDFTGFTGSFTNVARNISGNLTFSTGMTVGAGTGVQTLNAASGTQVIKTNGQTLDFPVTQNNLNATLQLFDNLTLTPSRTFTLTAGTLDLGTNTRTLSTGLFSSSGSSVRSIIFGTGQINVTGNSATVWTTSTATNFTYTGTPTVEANYNGSAGTRTIQHGVTGGSESNAVSFNISAGTDIVTISGTGSQYKNLIFTGFAGTYTQGNSIFVYGDLLISTGMTVSSSSNTMNLASTSGTQLITSNGKTLDFAINFTGVGSTKQIQDNLTIGSTRQTTLTSGTLNLNNQTLSTGLFNSDNSNTRSIAFGTGNITITGNDTTVWSMATATNFTYTGTSNVNLTYAGSTGTRFLVHGATAGGVESNAVSFNITAGTDTVALDVAGTAGVSAIKNLNFTGFTGLAFDTFSANIYGNCTLGAGMTTGSGDLYFVATSGTQTIISNGVTLDGVQINAPGATVQLADALIIRSTQTLSFINGTFTTNNYNVTAGRYALNAGTRTINMGSSTFLAQGTSDTTASWNVTNATNLTINAGTSTIQLNETFTGTSTQDFAGGGQTYYNLVISGGQPLTIIDGNTFNNITNTVTPLNLNFGAGTTNNFVNWNILGIPSNNVVINSSDGVTSFTLNYTGSGFVSTNYLTISNSTATPGSTWYAGADSTDSGNNSGWVFAYAPVRYWVGGSGNWDATTTTNWSVTSGGTAGVTAPSSTDSVIFDANSNVGTGAFTVTVTGTSSAPALCNDFTAGSLDGAMTLALGGTGQINVYGSLTLPASNLSVTGTGTAGLSEIQFAATTTGKTITTNGVSLSAINAVRFSGIGGGWTLGSALTGPLVLIQAGTFDTANYNITIGNLQRTGNTGTTTINLGSSAISCSAGTPINFTVTTGLTFNAGTSQITCLASAATFVGGGLTFYNVSFTSNAAGTVAISGINTFNNLTYTSLAATGLKNIQISANQTINGTLTFGTANTAIRRMAVLTGTTPGPAVTITLNGTLAALSDVDFRGFTAAGTFGTWSGTRLGDGGNNTNITFPAGVNKYWNLAAGSNWSATAWALSSGGAVNVNNFPLPQDTVIIENTGLNTGATITIDQSWWWGNIDCSTRTNAYTLSWGNADPIIYGNFTLSSAATVISATSPSLNFYNYNSTKTITTAGVTLPVLIQIYSYLGTVRLLDNLNVTSSIGVILQIGTLDLNNNTLTCLTFSSSNSNTRAIAFGTGNITVTGNDATVFNGGGSTTTAITITGTPNVNLTYSGSTGTRLINGGARSVINENNTFNFNISAGSDTLSLQGSGAFKNINFTGFTGTWLNNSYTIYGDLTISSGMTVTGGTGITTLSKTSGIQQITSNGKTLDFPIIKSVIASTLQLQDNLTLGSTRIFTLTAGTLNLNNQTLSTGLFNSDNSNTRAIAFGTGQINITGNDATIWSTDTATNLTVTGTPNVNFTYAGSTGTRGIASNGSTTGGTEANAFNLNITAGSDIISVSSTRTAKNFDFTGFSGTFTLAGAFWIYGNLVISPTMSVSSSTQLLSFTGTSGTQQITSNGKTLDFPVTQDGVGGTVQLQDAFTLGSTRVFTLTNGTLNVNSQTLTIGGMSSNNSNIRTLNLGTNGVISNSGAWNTSTSTNMTLLGTGTISMTSASAKTFQGGNLVFPYTLNQGGIGALSITGNNTFANLTNTVQPATIAFTAGGTTTFADFSLLGTLGNLISLRSGTPGTRYNFVYTGVGAIPGVNYLDIQDSAATPSTLTWYGGFNSVDSGNNTGWLFANVPILADITEPFTSNNINTIQANFAQSRAENIVMNDIRTITANFIQAVSENTNLNDLKTIVANFVVSITEATQEADILTIIQGFSLSIIENFGVNDGRVINAGFINAISENINVLDIRIVVNLYNITVIENVLMLDSTYITGWFRIDDSQIASWVNIPAVSSSGWTPINDSQSTNWSIIDTSQP